MKKEIKKIKVQILYKYVKLAELFSLKVVNSYISLSVTLFDSEALCLASLSLFYTSPSFPIN